MSSLSVSEVLVAVTDADSEQEPRSRLFLAHYSRDNPKNLQDCCNCGEIERLSGAGIKNLARDADPEKGLSRSFYRPFEGGTTVLPSSGHPPLT